MMAASMISMLPCIILFFAAQKWFIQGVVVSGVKG
jgi:ABC-type glycerol-3-phosphate transport system permease component